MSMLKEYFSNLFKNDKLSHAFLICNTNYDNLKDDLNDILLNYFFNDNDKVNIENCSDIYIIRPVNNKIVKEDIINLQESFMTKSQVNKNKVYIIDGAECMNDYAANSLLKFLEEPEEGIYAFLITSNINKVLPTIKSRCQILQIENESLFNINNYDIEIIDKSILFVKTFEKYGIKTIAYNYKFLEKKEEKETILNLVNIVKYFYRDTLNYKLLNEIKYFNNYIDDIKLVCEKNSEKTLINKLMVLNKNENMLEYNLNLNLFMDKLIIEMGMISSE